MNLNNNITPLAWYQWKKELQSHRADYAYGRIVPLYVSSSSFIPFQIIVPADWNNPNPLQLTLYDTNDVQVVSSRVSSLNGFKIFQFTEYSVLAYIGNGAMGLTIPTGQYYAKLEYVYEEFNANNAYIGGAVVMYKGTVYIFVGAKDPGVWDASKVFLLTAQPITYYSDVFTVIDDISNYTKIEWRCSEDVIFDSGRIVYSYNDGGVNKTYSNIMYFAEQIGKPAYPFDEEGETRDGLFYVTKQVSSKTYKMVTFANEVMCDAMRLIRMSDIITVTDGYGRPYSCNTLLVTPEWQEQGDVASVKIEFTCNTFIKMIGRGFTATPQTNSAAIGSGEIASTFII